MKRKKPDYKARMDAIRPYVTFSYKHPHKVSPKHKARISRAFSALTHSRINSRLATLSQGTRLFAPKDRSKLKQVAKLTGYGRLNRDILAIRVPKRQRYQWRKGKLVEVREDTPHLTVRNFTADEFKRRAASGKPPLGKRYAVMVFGEYRRVSANTPEEAIGDYEALRKRYGETNLTGFAVWDYRNQRTLKEFLKHRRTIRGINKSKRHRNKRGTGTKGIKSRTKPPVNRVRTKRHRGGRTKNF